MASDLALSIILPVHNAESTLAAQVSRVLEVAPDIAPGSHAQGCGGFEVLIVDDGSTDHTSEVAHELAVVFPQVRVTRHSQRRGAVAAARTGVSQARGEITFVHEGRSPLKASDLPRLWSEATPIAPSREDAPETAIVEAELVAGQADSRTGRPRVRALADAGRIGPPASKITPRRRVRQPFQR